MVFETLQPVQVIHFLLDRILPLGIASFAIQAHAVLVSVRDQNAKFLSGFLLLDSLVSG